LNILFYCTFANEQQLFKIIKKKFIGNKLYTINNKVDFQKIDIAMIWNLPDKVYKKLVNLKLIFSLGAGVDHIIKLPSYNKTPIIRIKDPNMRKRMFNHVLSQILNYQLKMPQYFKAQQKKIWLKEQDTLLNHQLNVGIIGIGYLGSFIASQLKKLDYKVIGYKHSPTSLKFPFRIFTSKSINQFITQCDILVSILPSTKKTNNFINKSFLNKLKKNTLLINIGRGSSLSEQDLLNHLKLNPNCYASLDVFKNEPIKKNHKFWKHPNITVTPHVAAITDIESSINYMYSRFLIFKKYGKIKSDVNLKKGY